MKQPKRDYRPPSDFPADPPQLPHVTGSGLVAIVTPAVSSRLSADERVSFDLMNRMLPGFDRYLVIPESLTTDIVADGLRTIRLPNASMASFGAYNRLMLTPWFYRLFSGYRYILIHQLDCLVFRPDLPDWCAQGWSYVGAPWFGRRGGLKAVGNGGLSLRSVADAVAVLESDHFRAFPATRPQLRQFASMKHLRKLLGTLGEARRDRRSRPLVQRFLDRFDRPEDEFWAYYARFFHPAFRQPAPRAALDFAFEASPHVAYELLGRRLPFGCHAWARMGRDFWLERLAEERLVPDTGIEPVTF